MLRIKTKGCHVQTWMDRSLVYSKSRLTHGSQLETIVDFRCMLGWLEVVIRKPRLIRTDLNFIYKGQRTAILLSQKSENISQSTATLPTLFEPRLVHFRN